MHAVEVSHVVKSYTDKVAVDDLSFSVESGEIFGLIGPNGAGKTTTIRMIMDIIRPDKGNIAILGEELSEASKGVVSLNSVYEKPVGFGQSFGVRGRPGSQAGRDS